jgi:hypothetical protein
MTLKDVVSVAGKPGLYKVLKITRNGMIIEAMEGKPIKSVVNASHRISVLKDISIYTHTQDESVALGDVFSIIIEKKGKEPLQIDTKDNVALLAFLEEIVPEYDREKVYASDVKKLVNWFNALLEKAPTVFDKEEPETPKEEEKETETIKEEPKATDKEEKKKPVKKKKDTE